MYMHICMCMIVYAYLYVCDCVCVILYMHTCVHTTPVVDLATTVGSAACICIFVNMHILYMYVCILSHTFYLYRCTNVYTHNTIYQTRRDAVGGEPGIYIHGSPPTADQRLDVSCIALHLFSPLAFDFSHRILSYPTSRNPKP
jgi:hypothetical protein